MYIIELSLLSLLMLLLFFLLIFFFPLLSAVHYRCIILFLFVLFICVFFFSQLLYGCSTTQKLYYYWMNWMKYLWKLLLSAHLPPSSRPHLTLPSFHFHQSKCQLNIHALLWGLTVCIYVYMWIYEYAYGIINMSLSVHFRLISQILIDREFNSYGIISL